MKVLLKNYLLQNNKLCFLCMSKAGVLLALLFIFKINHAQVANYVSNGGFENLYNCNGSILNNCKNWLSIDSISYAGANMTLCNGNVPINGNTYQNPKSGNSYVLSTFYCLNPNCGRGYLKNRLVQNLQGGTVYCVKFHVNIANTSPRGMDGYGIYFGSNLIDTITKCNIPLSYITPQVKNTVGNIISDTLNWIAITGTFTAIGNEKYALLGNFLSNSAVNTSSINTPSFPQYWTDVCIDDVSCIPLDLPAYAGPDIWGIPTTTVYLGRQQDVGIDEACMWYKLPNVTTAIDTAAGITVTIGLTSNTYVVRQEICGNVKWDTVIVYPSATGLSELEYFKNNISLFPNPATDNLNITLNFDLEKEFTKIEILNSLGQLIREEDIVFKNKNASIKTGDLPSGVYFINLSNEIGERTTKKLVIE
jgi:hypothetical protein